MAEQIVSNLSHHDAIEWAINGIGVNTSPQVVFEEGKQCQIGLTMVNGGEVDLGPSDYTHTFTLVKTLDELRFHARTNCPENKRVVYIRVYPSEEPLDTVKEVHDSSFHFFWEEYAFFSGGPHPSPYDQGYAVTEEKNDFLNLVYTEGRHAIKELWDKRDKYGTSEENVKELLADSVRLGQRSVFNVLDGDPEIHDSGYHVIARKYNTPDECIKKSVSGDLKATIRLLFDNI